MPARPTNISPAKFFAIMPVVGLVLVAACSDSVTGTTEDAALLRDIVLTEGMQAPTADLRPTGPRRSDLAGEAPSNLGGSTTHPVSLKPSTCESGFSQEVTITYRITGRQDNPASFDVNTNWSYNGSDWTGSVPETVIVPPRAAGGSVPATVREVVITVSNASTANSGSGSFAIVPFDVDTEAPAALSVTNGNVTVNVAFVACPVSNTPPTLVFPSDLIKVEATSSAGAVVDPLDYVTANDLEDGSLTSSIVCTPIAGTFAIGDHTFDCEVEDSGGLTDDGSFTVRIQDTTPAEFTTFPTGTVSKIAQAANGWVFDKTAFGITVADKDGVSEPATFACDIADGAVLAIGSSSTVECTAKDALDNESDAESFTLEITLDISGANGFMTPLRMASPYSSHKQGSAIPHKFPAPLYADGSPATDLAAGLQLVLKWQSGGLGDLVTEPTDFAAGSTTWRYDSDHYVFNAKSAKNWSPGTWSTTVKYAGVILASTTFGLTK